MPLFFLTKININPLCGGGTPVKKLILVGVLILLMISLVFNVPNGFLSQEHQVKVTDKIKTIDLDIKGVDSTIISKDQDYVKAELKGKGNVNLSKKGDTIEIEYHRPLFSFFNFGSRTQLVVTIPKDFDRELKVDVGSGDIDFQLSKDTVLTSLELDVHSGDIDINSLNTKIASLDVSSGDIDLKHFTGELAIDVSSGDVYVQIDELVGDIEAEVNSGQIVLDLPDDSDFTLNGEISSGAIHNHFPLKNEKNEKNRLRGTHGSGKYSIDLEISSGTIEIK